MPELTFPLFDRARQAGILDGKSALIVAPTATGKSYIGRQALYRALRTEVGRLNVYLVPFRALAREMYETVRDELAREGTDARVRVATGDYTDPVRPDETDLLIATYERFAGLLESRPFRLGTLVADEFHLLDDETRGPTVEGLVARIMARRRPSSFIALSAVIENGENLADWLRVGLVVGSREDRAVRVDFECDVVASRDTALQEALGAIDRSKQALVFCRSRAAAEKVARQMAELCGPRLTEDDRRQLADLSQRITQETDDGEALASLLQSGAAYHHAGLTRPVRQAVEGAFRAKNLRVIASTPTLAAGVNLPADLVVVRDVYRTEVVRGRAIPVLLPSGELLNMLGRAGRPHLTDEGRGVVLIENKYDRDPAVKDVRAAVEAGRGSPVTSKLPDSFDALLRFVLSGVVDRGEVTREEITQLFQWTLWYHERPEDVSFGREFEEDMMEDLPSYKRAKGLRLAGVELAPDGVEAVVRSGPRKHPVALRVARLTCDCEAAHYRRSEVCKHAAFMIHELLFGKAVESEVRARAVYACLHVFRETLDLGTKLSQAVELLLAWGLLERVTGGAYRATPVGRIASGSRFDILLVRQAADRVREASSNTVHEDVALWTVDDYFGEIGERGRWSAAVEKWIKGVEDDKIALPTKFRGDFENRLEDLARVASLYGELAREWGREDLSRSCERARGVLLYGVPAAAVRLAALRFPGLGRRRCLRLLHDFGIRDVDDLSAAHGTVLHLPGVGARMIEDWISRAKAITARRPPKRGTSEEPDPELDSLLSEFQVEPLSLFAEVA